MVILANFKTTADNVVPNFPFTGTWYDLMDETGSTTINVTDTASPINIPAGEFRMYGNQLPSLSTDEVSLNNNLTLYPNPASTSLNISENVQSVEIFSLVGQKVMELNNVNAVDVSSLQTGLYMIKLTNVDGVVGSTKFMKQ